MKNYVWVIEVLNNKEWLPCSACGISKDSAKTRMKEWKKNNPCDKFRICKYVRDAQ